MGICCGLFCFLFLLQRPPPSLLLLLRPGKSEMSRRVACTGAQGWVSRRAERDSKLTCTCRMLLAAELELGLLLAPPHCFSSRLPSKPTTDLQRDRGEARRGHLGLLARRRPRLDLHHPAPADARARLPGGRPGAHRAPADKGQRRNPTCAARPQTTTRRGSCRAGSFFAYSPAAGSLLSSLAPPHCWLVVASSLRRGRPGAQHRAAAACGADGSLQGIWRRRRPPSDCGGGEPPRLPGACGPRRGGGGGGR